VEEAGRRISLNAELWDDEKKAGGEEGGEKK